MTPAGSPTRRRVLRGVLAAGTGGLGIVGAVGPAEARSDGFQLASGPTVRAETVATGFTAPLAFATPTGDGHRYVADQPGRIHALGPDGDRSTFLDLRDRVVEVGGYDERGLLGLSFHPEYPDVDRFYVRYSAPSRAGTPAGYSHTSVLSEFVADGPRAADPGSERALLEIPQPQANHNAGAIAFGPDGYLYVGVGDGGGSNDTGRGHVEDWYDANAGGNGQDVEANLLGSVLRLDVDGRDGDRPYGIPSDNPLVGTTGRDEHYAWGFRNPWGLSFDGGTLYAADVGQNRYEEVNRVMRGGNYGWNVREATHCFGTQGCPDRTPEGEPLIDPVIEYPHEADGERIGQAVIGGHRYRGSALPDLEGAYVFGDYLARGRLFAATPGETAPWEMAEVPIEPADGTEPGRYLRAVGRDTAGELYVLTSANPGVDGSTGRLHRLVGTARGDDGTAGTATGVTGSGSVGTPGQPGFGVLGALAGAGWFAYRRRRGNRRE